MVDKANLRGHTRGVWGYFSGSEMGSLGWVRHGNFPIRVRAGQGCPLYGIPPIGNPFRYFLSPQVSAVNRWFYDVCKLKYARAYIMDLDT